MKLFLDRPSPSGEDGVIEGVLTRKHEWESTTKKASNRSWDKVKTVMNTLNYGISRCFLILRFILCRNSVAFHSTRTRNRPNLSQIRHSAVNQPLNYKVLQLKSLAITQRRNMCSELSKLLYIDNLKDKTKKIISGLQMVVNFYFNHMTTPKCSNGLVH